MPALRELQLAFVAAMFGESDGVEAHVHNGGMSADARLSIYQNNLREGFIKALALTFPVVERLGGTDYFRQLALEFLAAHPSRSGNLHHIGAPFAPLPRSEICRHAVRVLRGRRRTRVGIRGSAARRGCRRAFARSIRWHRA